MSGAHGAGRALAALYALFALAAGARSIAQIATAFDRAPLAYLLSALAAAVYVVIAARIGSDAAGDRRIALGACCFELLGVISVGMLTVVDPGLFADQTVWSDFGLGYGLLPLAMPLAGIAWLVRTERVTARA